MCWRSHLRDRPAWRTTATLPPNVTGGSSDLGGSQMRNGRKGALARLEAPTPTPLGRHPLGHVWPHAQTQSRARSGVQRSRRAAIKHAGTSSRLTLRLAVSVQSATAAATILALRKVCFCLILGQIDRLYQKHSASMQRKGADLCMSSIYADGVLASAVFICFFGAFNASSCACSERRVRFQALSGPAASQQ